MVENLQRVGGIGAATLERITPLVTVELDIAPPEPDPVDEIESQPEVDPAPAQQADDLEAESIPLDDELSSETAIVPVKSENDKDKQKITPKPKYVTRGEAMMLAVGSSLVAFILALILVFGVLIGINGGLRFVRPAQAYEIDRQIEGINAQMGIVAQDIEGLRTRLANLEGVGERIDMLQADLDLLADGVAAVNEQIELLGTEVENLRAETAQFQEFLDGLRELLGVPSPPEETPTP
jgi:hypothetical protein